MNKFLKKILCASLSAVMIFSSLSVSFVFAEESGENIREESDFVSAVAEVLEMYARYESVDKGYLYEETMKKLISENPELYEEVLSYMLSSVDEHSVYYTEAEKAKLFEDLSDEIVGIGVTVLVRDGMLIVSQPVPGTPAEKAGIKVGDIIVSADGVELEGMDLDTAVSHVRGAEGSEVNLKIWRASVGGYLDFKIKRETVITNPVEYEIKETPEGEPVIWIRLLSFSENAAKHFTEALNIADENNIKNVIIDLRNNGGGYLSEAVGIADIFLPEGAVITSEDHKIALLNRTYKATGKAADYETVVLVNSMSASASEVLTAALSENNAAKVIGEQTFGKGTVQSITELKNGGAMKYTSAYYLTPKGNNINKIGITPDAVVENSLSPVDAEQFGSFTYSKVFSLGDKNDEILAAKKMLEYMGIFIGDINNVYDENLKAAVYTYQSLKEELFPYGELDKTTQLSLYKTISEMKKENDDQLSAALSAF